MTTWFIADTHFGDQPRGRQKATGMTAEQLDEVIATRWRESVGEDDVVWHLGDVGDLDRVGGLPGVKHLIFGNWDKRRKAIAASGVFASAADRHVFDTQAGPVLLIHDPAHASGDEGLVAHGHLHARPSPAPRFRSVSVDQRDWRPVTTEQLLDGWAE